MNKLIVAAAMCLLGSCAKSETVECSPELVCPRGTTCAHLTEPDDDICATEDQVTACESVGEGDACTYEGAPPSWCHDGVCIASACGNNRRDPGEVCDDGNTVTGDGTCSGDCASTEVCGNSIVDPLGQDMDGNPVATESCDDGNRISSDGCSSTCKVEQPQWAQLGQRPVPLVGSSVAYDSVRGRLMMFGGERDITSNNIATNGLYEWNGSDWSRVPTVGGPAGRRNAGVVFDAARRKLVVFAGTFGDSEITPFGDVWEWDGNHWTLRVFTTAPPARARFGMVYDSARKKIVVFGGAAHGVSGDVPLGDTWEYDGTSWTETTASGGPLARMGMVMAYDPRRGVTVMAGGYDGNLGYRRDTWEYDGAWQPIATAAAPSDLDHASAMAFEPSTGNMITFGGEITPTDNLSVSNRTLSYNGSAWNVIAATQPGTLRHVALGTDVRAGKVVLFGGEDQNSLRSGATWTWSGSAWTSAPVFTPPALRNSSTAHDPLRGITWLFGGQTSTSVPTNHLWSFDGLTWKRHLAAGPTARWAAATAFDPIRNQLVVFGGAVYDSNNRYTPTTGETWVYDGTAWTSSTPTSTPSPRFGAAAYFDPNRGRIVLYGGSGVDLTPFADTWEWDGTAWQPIAATGPAARGFVSAAFDAARDSSVLWGGFSLDTGGAPFVLTDTWRFDGTSWMLAVPVNPMPRRIWSELAYDPTSRHVTMFGGMDLGASGFADTWQWNGTAWDPVLTPDSPPSRGAHVTFSANDGRGVVIFGGSDDPDGGGNSYADTWRLRYENAQPLEQCLVSVDDDGDGLTGCADEDCWAYCNPLCPPGAACEPTAPHCGDNTCNAALESCRNCPQDCATCTAVCGDSSCDAPETMSSCVGDCTP